jgi:hypothetical protein
MRRFYLIGLAVLALTLIRPSFSTAADIYCIESYGPDATTEVSLAFFAEAYKSGRRPNSDTCRNVLIKGPIAFGDAVKFSRPFLQVISLKSSGGSVEEAIKIGHIIRKNLLLTKAPYARADTQLGFPTRGSGLLSGTFGIYSRPWRRDGPYFAFDGMQRVDDLEYCNGYDCHCASACFVIWAAGYSRLGSSLGLHRPSSTSTTFANMPPDRASVAYRLLISDIDRYLTEMEVPRRFIEMMIDTRSNDIRWLQLSEALELWGIPSIEEWLDSSCGKLPKSERKNWSTRDEIPQKMVDIYICRELKLTRARDAITD